jgi:hypothetical protein
LAFKALIAGSLLTTASAASASVVVALPGGTAIPIPGLNLTTNSSTAIGGGITFSSIAYAGSTLGNTGTTVFGNGTFGPGDPYLSLNASANGYNYATMSLTFDTPTSGFLADIRWTDGGPEIGNLSYVSASIAAYNAAGTLIEVYQFNNNGVNIGRPPGTYGFSRATADISRIDFNNAFMGARDLQYIGPAITAAVPEPTTWLMAILGFGLLGGALRRRRRSIGGGNVPHHPALMLATR